MSHIVYTCNIYALLVSRVPYGIYIRYLCTAYESCLTLYASYESCRVHITYIHCIRTMTHWYETWLWAVSHMVYTHNIYALHISHVSHCMRHMRHVVYMWYVYNIHITYIHCIRTMTHWYETWLWAVSNMVYTCNIYALLVSHVSYCMRHVL